MSDPLGLPGYKFDRATGSYLFSASGATVSRDEILFLLDRATSGRADTMQRIAEYATEGRILPADFELAFAQMLKQQYTQLAILGKGGIEQMMPGDWGRIGGYLKPQYGYVSNFAAQIAAGEVSVAQATSRADMYLGGARRAYLYNERLTAVAPTGQILMERRVLGVAEHCPDCMTYESMGWQPQGLLPLPGEASVCNGHCRCALERRAVPADGSAEWKGTSGGPDDGWRRSGLLPDTGSGRRSLDSAFDGALSGPEQYPELTGFEYGDGPSAKTETMLRLSERLEYDPDFAPVLDLFADEELFEYRYGATDVQNAVGRLVDKWSETSGNGDPLACALQAAAEKEFGLSTPNWHTWSATGIEKMLTEEWDFGVVLGDEKYQLGLRRFVRAMYDETQEALTAMGVDDEIWLWRGMSLKPGTLPEGVSQMMLDLQPMSSFSSDYTTASEFASMADDVQEVVVGAWVPKERVVGVPGHGFGCLDEYEYVVLGGGDLPAYAGVDVFAEDPFGWFDAVREAMED